MYVWLWAANTAWVLGFYAVCRRVFAFGPWTSFLACALTLVNPAHVTWPWLSLFARRVSYCLAVAHILLQDRVLTGGRKWLAIPGALCLFASLLITEMIAGLLVALPLIAWHRRSSWKDKRALLITPAVFALYVLLRLGQFGGVNDYRLQRVILDPATIANRLVLGSKVLIVAWLEPIELALGVSRTGAALLLISACVFFGVSAWRLTLHVADRGVHGVDRHLQLGQLLVGPAVAAAGYFPVILVAIPRLRLFDTRVNELAAVGASIALVAATVLLTSSIECARRRRTVQFAVLVPLLALGLTVQLAVRHDRAVSWESQRRIWSSVIQVVPGLEPGTVVAFDASGFQPGAPLSMNRFGVPHPLRGLTAWDVTNALRLIYEERDLSGVVLEKGRLQDGRLLDFRSKEPVESEVLVVLRLERDASVRVVLPGEIVEVDDVEFDLSGYDPLARVRHGRRRSLTAAALLGLSEGKQ